MSNLMPISEYVSVVGLLTADEQVIVRELLSTDLPTSEVIPDDMSPTDLWRYLAATCKGINRTQEASARLKLFLGRILVQVQKHPELYKSQEYDTFNSFITDVVPKLFGISRPEAFIVKKISEELGDTLQIDEMESIGVSKLNVAANSIRQKNVAGTPDDIRQKTVDLWVERAKTSSLEQMKQFQVDDGLKEAGEVDTVSVIFQLKEGVYERFKMFRAQPWVRKKAGESDSEVFEALMAEAAVWEAEAEDSV